MNSDSSNGWNESAGAWIADQGEDGDYGRRFVLDQPMIARIQGRRFETALDVGCGEGRFCRIMQKLGLRTVGIDPTEAFIRQARQLDPSGDYRIGRAEALDVAEGSFDLVVSYLSLIDIPDLAGGIARMVSALRRGGTLLIANLTSFNTAGLPDGWKEDDHGHLQYCIDNYLDERAIWVNWHSIRTQTWHRPLSTYMGLLLASGMDLRHFSEPEPTGGEPRRVALHRRVPFFHLMEWQRAA